MRWLQGNVADAIGQRTVAVWSAAESCLTRSSWAVLDQGGSLRHYWPGVRRAWPWKARPAHAGPRPTRSRSSRRLTRNQA